MHELTKRSSMKAGLPPGTMIHVGEKRTESVKMSLIKYNGEGVEIFEDISPDECKPHADFDGVFWINITGIHDLKIIETLGSVFEIHPLVLEDIVHAGQRPKVEDMDRYLFVVLKMLMYEQGQDQVMAEQVSLIVGENYVLSFQETAADVFDPVRRRIFNGKSRRMRNSGSDYLAYALMDAIVDQYFTILEYYGEKVEALQEEVLASPTTATLGTIQGAKRDMIFLRRSVWPLREALSTMERGGSSLMTQEVTLYIRDVYDHTIQVMDGIETFRDMLAGTLDIYLSSVSNRMNEVMKVLTIIATIFIPLTFIAGIYGMNFEHMPELKWLWSYPAIMLFMLCLGLVMLLMFKKKHWL
ncbi:MAG TPA: magnesium/cobalt transporter CorA [Desulfobacteraceae bacterium]|nr:magnesium/cobalt transporter CorA [Desulfobacteraceae bacterium]